MFGSEYSIRLNEQRYMRLVCLTDGQEKFVVDTLSFTQKELGVLIARSLKALFHADTDDRFAQLIAAQEKGAQRIVEVMEEASAPLSTESEREQIFAALNRFELAVMAKANTGIGAEEKVKEKVRWEYEDSYEALKEVLAIKE